MSVWVENMQHFHHQFRWEIKAKYQPTIETSKTCEKIQVNTFHDTHTAAMQRPRSFGTLSYAVGGIDWARRVDIAKVYRYPRRYYHRVSFFYLLLLLLLSLSPRLVRGFFFIYLFWIRYSLRVVILVSVFTFKFCTFWYERKKFCRHTEPTFSGKKVFFLYCWVAKICKATKFNWISFFDRKLKFA